MKKIMVLGATSAIAEAYIKMNAKDNHWVLISRNTERLEAISLDSINRCALSVTCLSLELSNPQNVESFISEHLEKIKNIDILLIASGTLPKQELIEKNTSMLVNEININAVSIISFINEALLRNILNPNASLAVITSVAGDRGRKSNYVYGSAKASLSTYLEGLWHKYANTQLKVLDIKPGFVDTPMTKDFKKGFLWNSPEKIAAIIADSLSQKKTGVKYAPSFWRFIMFIIKGIPRFIFKRTNF